MALATCSAWQAGSMTWPTGWGTSGRYKIISDREFVFGGKIYPAGRVSDPIDQNWCALGTISVSGGVPTFTAFTLPQTDTGITIVNGSGEPRLTLVYYAASGGKKGQIFSNWRIGASLTASFNFESLAIYNSSISVINPRTDFLGTDAISNLITARLYAPATTTQNGLVQLSANPTDSAAPKVVVANDYADVSHAALTRIYPNPDVSTIPVASGVNNYARTDNVGGVRVSVAPAVTAAVAATGSFGYNSTPLDGDTITANGAVFTFRNTPSAVNDIQISGFSSVLLNNITNALNASVDSRVTLATYARVGSAVTITYDVAGQAGNLFTTSSSGVGVTADQVTLTGGLNANVPTAVGSNDYAGSSNRGITRLSTAPASASAPIAYGVNDTKLPAFSDQVFWASQYSSFNAAVTAIGATPGVLIVSQLMTLVTTVSIPATLTLQFIGAGAISVVNANTVTILGPIVAPLSKQIFAGAGLISFTGNVSIAQYSIDWFGAITGTTDTTVCQAAAAAFPIGAYVKLIPNRTYATKWLSVKQGQIWDLTGATLIALNSGGANNELFDIGATTPIDLGGTVWTTKTAMSSATQGATSITVTSSSGFVAGDRIVVSAGSFTGSGVEFGPIEFNTVASIPDATHIVVTAPLAYNYSGFGLAGATNLKVYKVPSTQPRNVKIFGGTIQADAAFNSIYFNINGAENIEIYGITFNGGAALTTGGYVSGLNFHDNVLKGTGLVSAATVFNFASLVYSRITKNLINLTGNTLLNGSNLEVTCHDNIIESNTIGPLRATSVAAIEFNKYSFNNQIINNRIWGLDTDIAAGVGTLGIRAFAQSTPTNTGSVISGNLITDIMVGIGDGGSNSMIASNSHYNATVHAFSVGITIPTGSLGTIGINQFRGLTTILSNNSGGSGSAVSLLPAALAQSEGAALSVSSNTIAPTNAIHQVGAGLIKTITVPSGFISGSISLVPTAAFTYDATGNILGTGTAVIGRTMVATYSSSTSKWSMSY